MRRVERPSGGVVGLVDPVQAVQREGAVLQQGGQRGRFVGQQRAIGLYLVPLEHRARDASGPGTTALAASRLVEQLVGQLQGSVEASRLHQKVELVGAAQGCRAGGGAERLADPGLALLLAAQGEQRSRLALPARGVVGSQLQRSIRVLEGPACISLRHEQASERVVYVECQIPLWSLQQGQAGLEVGDRRSDLAALGGRAGAQPQAARLGGILGQHAAGECLDRGRVPGAPGLLDPVCGQGQIVRVQQPHGPLQQWPRLLGPFQRVQRPQLVLQQAPHGLAMVAERGHALATSRPVAGVEQVPGCAQGWLRGAADDVHHAGGEFERRVVATGDVELEQQVGEVELHPRPGCREGAAHGLLAVLVATDGEQGLRLQVEGGRSPGLQAQGALGVVQGLCRVSPGEAQLGEGVLQLLGEPRESLGRRVPRGTSVGPGRVHLTELEASERAQPPCVGVLPELVQREAAQLGHDRPVGVASRLVQQADQGRVPVVRRAVDARRQHCASIVRAVEAVQRTHPVAQQRGQGFEQVRPYRRDGGGRLALAQGVEPGRHPVRERVGLAQPRQQRLADVEGRLEAPALDEQVQQVGQPGEVFVGGRTDALADPGLAVVLHAHAQQGAGLDLGALHLVRLQLQRAIRLVDRGLEVPACQVDLGQGVVDRVLEVGAFADRGGQARLQVRARAIEVAQLAAGRASHPQGVGQAASAVERGTRHLLHEIPVAVRVRLEQQLAGVGQILVVHGVEQRA